MMFDYVLKRLFLIIPTLIGIILITFIVIRLAPGDPAEMKLRAAGQSVLADQAALTIVEETRRLYGLDKPLPQQFWIWITRVATLNFGTSYKDGRPVITKIAETLPITLTLNFLTLFIVYFISIPWGVLTAIKPAGFFDRFSALILFIL